jgi:hypothetical protein
MRPIVGRVAGLIPVDFGPVGDHALLACDTPQKRLSHGFTRRASSVASPGLRPDEFLPGGQAAARRCLAISPVSSFCSPRTITRAVADPCWYAADAPAAYHRPSQTRSAAVATAASARDLTRTPRTSGLLRPHRQPGDDRRLGELVKDRQEKARTHRHHGTAIPVRLVSVPDDRTGRCRGNLPRRAGCRIVIPAQFDDAQPIPIATHNGYARVN